MIKDVMTNIHAQQPLIDGSTRLFAIIGDPIGQVKSPQKLNPRFAEEGMNAVLIPVNIKPDRFEETVRGLMAIGNLDGIIITAPYKNRILPLLDHVLPMAAKVDAANAMRREADSTWSGEMFDGTGMVRGLREAAVRLEGRQIMLIGAGSAVAVAVADAGAKTMTIFDVDTFKAKALADRVAAAFPNCAVCAGPVQIYGHDTLINATPIGMAPGDGLPAPVDGLNSDMLVIDVIIKPETTPLLDHARALGCRTFNGRVMLDGQAEELVRFFSNRDRS
jgi:shikimate dehydrogenase